MLAEPIQPPQVSEILVEKIGEHVALVTLNRPEVCNAVNATMARKMMRVIAQLEADAEVRVVIVTGAGGKSFCSGADLAEVANSGKNIAEGPTGFAGFVYAERKKPWISAVRGHALGGGTEIALACEMVVAGVSSRFGLPEVKRNLVPGAGGAYRLPRSIPRVFANEIILTGEPVTAQRAFEFGLINYVVADDDVIPQALRLAKSVAGNAPLAVRESLRLLRMANDHTDEEMARETLRTIGRLMHTHDFKEGPRAFLERRAPEWTGR